MPKERSDGHKIFIKALKITAKNYDCSSLSDKDLVQEYSFHSMCLGPDTEPKVRKAWRKIADKCEDEILRRMKKRKKVNAVVET